MEDGQSVAAAKTGLDSLVLRVSTSPLRVECKDRLWGSLVLLCVIQLSGNQMVYEYAETTGSIWLMEMQWTCE